MSSKNQTDTEATGTQSTSDQSPSPWKHYKRYSDGKKVEARLKFTFQEGVLMEVKESSGYDRTCPGCSLLLSKGNGDEMPNSFLPPDVFHSRHKPLDDYKP